MVFLCVVLGSLVSYIFFEVFTQSASSGNVLDSMMAATVILSASIWGGAAWIVSTIKKLELSKSRLDE